MGHRVAERSLKDADFVCFLHLAWRLWKSVVTLAVTGKTISGQVFRRHRVPISDEQLLPLPRSRWDIRWLSGH
jgi:hypothetical protein